MGILVYTLGHSTRTPQEFLSILDAFSIELMVDIRTVPRSRKNPQYDREEFNASFRGYADYMQTAEFASAIEELIALAAQQTLAIVCAEAVPWRCHRSLVGDALLVRGIEVRDILNASVSKPHKLTPWASADGLCITYPQQGASAGSK